jgi:methylphosphotriester-DNA--protein-cysteine methyltransferase
MIKTDLGAAVSDDDWACLLARGQSAGYYAVLTTGIVCRHGCPARTPLRKNVRIFGSYDDARHAGYRPCKRCRPTASTPENWQSNAGPQSAIFPGETAPPPLYPGQ